MKAVYPVLKRKFVRTSLYQSYKSRIQKQKNPTISSKSDWLLFFKSLFGISVLVETGTYLGETLMKVQYDFKTIYSIELNTAFAEEAKQYFHHNKKVKILQGDSGLILQETLASVQEPVLFWLDAHYSAGITAKSDVFGNTPIKKELEIIFNRWNKGSVVVIDDAACFNGTHGYPTVEAITQYVIEQNLNLRVSIANGAINIF